MLIFNFFFLSLPFHRLFNSTQQVKVNTHGLSPLFFQNTLEAVECALKC